MNDNRFGGNGGPRRWARRSMGICALCLVLAAPVYAAAGDDDGVAPRLPSLLQVWLSLPHVDRIAWPYAFVVEKSVNAQQNDLRKNLFDEFKDLNWRLKSAGYENYLDTIEAWRSRLSQTRVYRLPGDWSPAWLMSHPQQNPPLASLSALGACDVPDWVEIWDGAGIRRLPWHSGMTLDALFSADRISRRDIDYVRVVDSLGQQSKIGVAPWNASNANLSPGSRVVLPLPLGGEAFGWIRDTVADLLAHTPTGDDCRVTPLNTGGDGA